MNIKFYFLFLFHLFFSQLILCQESKSSSETKERYTISGHITFSDSIHNSAGAQVYLDSVFSGTITDFSGNYQLKNIKQGEYLLVAQYLGYEQYKQEITVDKNLEINIQLHASALTLESVSIVSDRLIDKTSVSDISMIAPQIESFKGLQEDPVNVLTLMPGITKGNSDLFSSTQLYVRGGGPEENRFLYNNVTVYWPWYSGGIKSVFNNEIIDKMELLTGGFSAKYGNAMSSIVHITTRDGNFNEFAGNFTVGLSGMQTTFEGPFEKDKVSALLSVRKTYLDLILGNSPEFPVNNMLDGTYRISWKINEKHKLSFSGLSSRETMNFMTFDPQPGMPDEINLKTKSNSQSLQLQSMWSDKLYANLSVYFSYNQSTFNIGNNLRMDLQGHEIGLREDLTYKINRRHKIDFGIETGFGMYRNKGNTPLNPLELDMNDTTILLREFDFNSESGFSALYFSYTGDITNKLSMTVGLRGDFLFYEYNHAHSDYSPRFSMKYKLLPKTNIRASFGYFNQFPDDEALTNIPNLKSNLCKHYIAGIEQNFNAHFKGWIEIYYKDYSNLVVFNTSDNNTDDLEFSNLGTGHVKGAELFLMRKHGSLTSWISYAYSIAKRQQSLHDKEYFFEYDRPHMLNLAAEYELSQKVSWYIPHQVSMQFRYEAGNPYTPVTGAVLTDNGWQQVRGEENSKRNPSFHSLSLKVIWLNEDNNKVKVKSFFEVWNVYNHKNLLGRTYQYGTEFDNNVKENKYYSTPFLPAGGVRIEF
ncbi:MAG: TonB-dependent receptor [Bacteroidales bacterium]|nr:TonB-dependent receptor [Bacteroidales bacterium]MBN2820740.1 TonB-dependent receptor [Bacteroidales bacterium]